VSRTATGNTLPLIAVVGERRELDGMPYHMAGEKYLSAVSEFVRGIPVLLPATVGVEDLGNIVDRFDGFLFCGSVTNVDPAEWQLTSRAVGPFDQARDRLSKALIELVIDRDVPSLFICRGMQELNAAFGGTLHPDVARVTGRMNHHSPQDWDYAERYAPRHKVTLEAGSPLKAIFQQETFNVNSLHYQALDQVAARLAVEAVADDDTPEAISLRTHRFAVGVQWHAEYRPDLSPPNRHLLEAFGGASLQYAQLKRQKGTEQ